MFLFSRKKRAARQKAERERLERIARTQENVDYVLYKLTEKKDFHNPTHKVNGSYYTLKKEVKEMLRTTEFGLESSSALREVIITFIDGSNPEEFLLTMKNMITKIQNNQQEEFTTMVAEYMNQSKSMEAKVALEKEIAIARAEVDKKEKERQAAVMLVANAKTDSEKIRYAKNVKNFSREIALSNKRIDTLTDKLFAVNQAHSIRVNEKIMSDMNIEIDLEKLQDSVGNIREITETSKSESSAVEMAMDSLLGGVEQDDDEIMAIIAEAEEAKRIQEAADRVQAMKESEKKAVSASKLRELIDEEAKKN